MNKHLALMAMSFSLLLGINNAMMEPYVIDNGTVAPIEIQEEGSAEPRATPIFHMRHVIAALGKKLAWLATNRSSVIKKCCLINNSNK